MRPWEGSPHSLAYGILDDETYDWLAVVEGMLETRGVPVVVSEEEIVAAYRLAREHSSIPVEPTGAAGLAGALQLRQSGLIASTDTVAVLFTGVERGE